MENWKEKFDDEGRSFVEFLREEDRIITCVACSKKINNKEDLDAIEKIYTHTRTIEHGFKLHIMLNLAVMEVIDLTNCDDRENWSPKLTKTNVAITRNNDGTLKISGLNPITYIVPIRDLPFMKKKTDERETSRKTVLSLYNYLTKQQSSPSKRKQVEGELNSSEENSSVSPGACSSNQVTHAKKLKTSQLSLDRWVKNDERITLNLSVSTTPQNIPQQRVQSITERLSNDYLSEGLTPINKVRPTKRGISQIIRARVVIKSDIHQFCNFLGQTTMFTIDLIDESGEIRLSAYGACVNKFYDSVKVDQIYYLSKFKVKLSDPSKTPVISEYNITCTENTIIRPCFLLPLQIPEIKFNFIPISNVENMAKDDIVDVIAICESFGEMQNVNLSNGSPGRKREMWLVDQSNTKIMMAIWGTNADNFDKNRPGDVIAVKRAKVKFYAKINLDSSCLSSSTFQINPQIPETDALRKWYCEKGDVEVKVLSLTERLSNDYLSEGLTPINKVRPTKRGISQIIRARVVIKSDIHQFCNFLGQTTMFTIDLIDESGEIRLSAYGACVNKFYDSVKVDQIYYLSKFKVKLSDPSKTPVISEYNITCTENTIIRPCFLLPLQIPEIKFNFIPISNVENMAKDDIVDVIAICESFGEMQNVNLSNGSPGRKREMWLVDQSNTKIMMAIWGTNADNFDKNRPGDVIAVKRAKVKFYAKINLDSSCLSSSTFQINPQIPETDALRKWYCEKGDVEVKVLSRVPRPRPKKVRA